ncbi:hypothetical protein RJ639_026053 [Escallonia herrerae]|uniref:Pre-SET domain-containing protein n=1 Tax=Escallonia herrerae TaxID=1293975 RepID=A0AA88USX2_9ASTE|nr:hypothetical protein RJ639_026053 [Escallonia herrerae]
MEPNQRGSKAFSAMKKLGVPKDTVKRILKNLLKLYGNNWELIEEDNYRTLADAIFEEAEDKIYSIKLLMFFFYAREDKNNDAKLYDGTEPPSKRPYFGQQEDRASFATDSKSKMLLLKEERKRYAAGDSGGQAMVPDIDPLGSTLAREMIVKKSISGSSKQPSGREKKNFFHRIRDITKGKERVAISLLDEIGNEHLPDFVYMSQSVVHQNAHVHVSLARIADEDSCSSCIGDCLSNTIPCACARGTGGEFAYTAKGLLKEEFVRACISVTREPQKHYKFVCQEFPLEKARKMYRPEPCKGHLLRKFIKECWTKCGCDMQCGKKCSDANLLEVPVEVENPDHHYYHGVKQLLHLVRRRKDRWRPYTSSQDLGAYHHRRVFKWSKTLQEANFNMCILGKEDKLDSGSLVSMDKALYERSRLVRFTSLLKDSSGIVSVRLLNDRRRIVSLVSLKKDLGTGPSKLLPLKSSAFNKEKDALLISASRPLKWLSESSILRNDARANGDDGMLPINEL